MDEITTAQKEEIDNMDYVSMLRLWRFGKSGNPNFVGERGRYFSKSMEGKREEIGNSAHVAASKLIGW